MQLITDVRWKQRFQHFANALDYFEQAMQIDHPDMIQKAGTIQFFEMCVELAWKTIKNYLHAQGFNEINSPRSALKKGFETGLIDDGHTWMELLDDRNNTAHTYDEDQANEVERLIREKYYPLLKAFHETFSSK